MLREFDEDELDEGDRKLIADVEQYGWHVVLVSEEDGTPGWAFSIGLYASFKHPEIMVFGLEAELMHSVINVAAGDICANSTFESGREYPNLLDGVECAFRTVDKRWYPPFLGYAHWFYGDDSFPALQLIWPDKNKHFPWEPDFDTQWRSKQPLLYESQAVDARVEHFLETMNYGEAG